MNNIAKFIAIAGVAAMLGGCAAGKAPARKVESPFHENSVVLLARPETFSLANLLRQLPGVTVNESHRNTTVFVRGGRPLFVLDNMRIGLDFNEVDRFVNVLDVTAVELVRDPGEIMIYGPDTQFGVIRIHTKPLNLGQDKQ